jgi:hypothetical protein
MIRRAIIAGLICAVAIGLGLKARAFINVAQYSVTPTTGVFDNAGQPWPFFSQINAVNYDNGGNGIGFSKAYNATNCLAGQSYRPDFTNFNAITDSGQTLDLGCIGAIGNYWNYTINISQPGPYVLDLRGGEGNSGASWGIYIDGNLEATIPLPQTGGYQVFQTFTSPSFNATLGNHTLRIQCATLDTAGGCGDIVYVNGAPVSGGGACLPGSICPPGNWSVAFQDEFTALSVDTSKWVTNQTCGRGGDPVNNSLTLSLPGDGMLHLKPVGPGLKDCNNRGGFNDGELYTIPGLVLPNGTVCCGPGYYEARLKGDANDYDAWWTLPNSDISCSHPNLTDGSEEDIMESAFGNAQNNQHWGGYGACHQAISSGDISSDNDAFHLWGLLWEPTNGFTFYRDGVQTWHNPGPVNNGSNPVSMIVNGGYRNQPTTGLLVDWVRYYQPGNGSSVTPPPSAVAAGFTTLAANYDFTQTLPSNWLACPGDNSAGHQFWMWWDANGTSPACSNVSQQTDPTTGALALRMTYPASNGNGGIQLTTHSQDNSQKVHWGNAVYEVVFRMVSTPSVPAPQYDTPGTQMVGWTYHDPGTYEYDIYEWYTFGPNCPDQNVIPNGYLYSGCPNPGPGPAAPNPNNYITAGMRITGNGGGTAACGYLGPFGGTIQQTSCATYGADTGQLNHLILWNGMGCGFNNGLGTCTNVPITSVQNNGGNTQVNLNASVIHQNCNGYTFIQGSSGIAGLNGLHAVSGCGTGSSWTLSDLPWPGGSYGGGGVWNYFTQTDVWVKSFRVWTCSTPGSHCDSAPVTTNP